MHFWVVNILRPVLLVKTKKAKKRNIFFYKSCEVLFFTAV